MVDFNWSYIYSYALKRLTQELIFTVKDEPFQVLLNLLTKETKPSTSDINHLFEHGLIEYPHQLSSFFKLLSFKYPDIQELFITSYLNHLVDKHHPELFRALRDFDKEYKHLLSFIQEERITPESLFQQFKFNRTLHEEDVAFVFAQCPEALLKNLFWFCSEEDYRHVLHLY